MATERPPLPATQRTLKLAVVGTAAGVFSGLFGVGGGSVIVPLLVLWLGYGPREATGTSLAAIVFIAAYAAATEATSLLAIVPVAIVGTFKQDGYGNVRRQDALVMGLLSVAGAAAGVALANALSGTVLRVGFALLMVFVAIQLVRKAISEPRDPGPPEPAAARRAAESFAGNRPGPANKA